MASITLKVPAIHCPHCVRTIERELRGLDGVEKVEGNAEAKTVQRGYWNPDRRR